MAAVLDTHAAIWYLLDSEKLSQPSYSLIEFKQSGRSQARLMPLHACCSATIESLMFWIADTIFPISSSVSSAKSCLLSSGSFPRFLMNQAHQQGGALVGHVHVAVASCFFLSPTSFFFKVAVDTCQSP